jgi:hypothetical protein
MTESTIFNHLEKLVEDAAVTADDIAHLWEETGRGDDEFENITDAFRVLGVSRLRPVYDRLNEDVSFEDLRIARMLIKLSQ